MASAEAPQRGELWLVSLGSSRPGEPGKNRFLRRLGALTPETTTRVEAALGLILGLAPAPPPEVLDQ